MKNIVTKIQRFCLQDGPGIRTTVFFKGCNLRCPWCCNPENISFEIQKYEDNGKIKYYGKEIDEIDIFNEVIKDKNFYGLNGGVTFSGGECLLHFPKIKKLLKKLKNEKINICIETALCVPKENIDIALDYVDEFYVDMKCLEDDSMSKIGEDRNIYIKNLKYLSSKCKDITIRIPIVKDYTYTEKNIEKMIKLINEINPKMVEIFNIHYLASKKYKTLGIGMEKFDRISDEKMEILKEKLPNCKIVKI